MGVGRASVVRTAQTLRYDGYPQLRVALARERVVEQPVGDPDDDGAVGVMRAAIARFGSGLAHLADALTEEVVETFVTALNEAGQVVIAANGLSAPLGYDIALRLATAGRSAALLPDGLGQAIAARQLGKGDVLLTVSGSGASRATLDVVDAARAAGGDGAGDHAVLPLGAGGAGDADAGGAPGGRVVPGRAAADLARGDGPHGGAAGGGAHRAT